MKEYKIKLECLRGKNGMNDFEVMFILPPFDEEEKVQKIEDEIEKFIMNMVVRLKKPTAGAKSVWRMKSLIIIMVIITLSLLK